MAYSKVILNGTTLMDVTQDTVDAANLLSGETATKNSGAKVTGTYTPPTFSTQSKTVTPSTTSQTVQPDSGYDGLSSVTVNAMPSGSASTPATSITANPSISVSSGGLITATASASQSVTPTVSAGYVSTGTAGTVTVSGSNTQQLTTQSAQTITPTTQNQTIAAGKYLTGAQTILGDANLLAENIKKDVSIFGVTGTLEGGGSGTVTATANMGMYTLCYTDANGQYQTAAGQVSFITVVVPANSLLIFLCDDMRVPSVTNMTAVASYSMGDRASYLYVRIYQAVQA